MNKRVDDLRKALAVGAHSNGNHTIIAGDGLKQDAKWCRDCPVNMRCFLIGQKIDIAMASANRYPCVRQAKTLIFKYHGATCLVFDVLENRVNDWGYWGYSVTTSRAIRWYVEALVELDYIEFGRSEEIINFFKKRKDSVGCNDAAIPWYPC